MAQRNFYTILWVPRKATPDTIRTAYRDLAKRHHPDRGLDCNVVAAAAPTGEGPHAMGKRLYVGNLALGIDNKDLEELFAEAGVCESAAVITDRATGRSRGFGYVEMASSGDAHKAIQQLDGQEFKGGRVCIYAVNSAGI